MKMISPGSQMTTTGRDASGLVMVLHGPEIFDSGEAGRLYRQIRPSRLVVAGVMARAAAEESGLPCEYPGLPPSQVLRGIARPSFLASLGKTPASGRIFGGMVAQRTGPGGIIQVECVCRRVICWGQPVGYLASMLAEAAGFPPVSLPVPPPQKEQGTRTLRGCVPGEPVYVNGVVIGTANADQVVIAEKDGLLVPVQGLEPKEHGLEKIRRMGPLDISQAWCKSGYLRSRSPAPAAGGRRRGRVAFVDHCGHALYQALRDGGFCGVVAVGDDTTAVCGHIGAHLGLPVFGIIDRDGDGVVPPGFAPGSWLAVTDPGCDDLVGRKAAGLILRGEMDWDDVVSQLSTRLAKWVRLERPGTK